MGTICGSMTINFSVQASKETLLTDFHEDLFKDGNVMLINVDNDCLEMEIHQMEYIDVDDDEEN